jgi:hypothetical protein
MYTLIQHVNFNEIFVYVMYINIKYLACKPSAHAIVMIKIRYDKVLQSLYIYIYIYIYIYKYKYKYKYK